MKDILIPTSPGELIDKLTILRIKADRIGDAAKRANVAHERAALQAIADAALPDDPLLGTLAEALQEVNATLWTIEDDIRACDAAGDFGPRFVALARAVYQTNDRRAAIKKRINLHLGSAIVEEKSYSAQGEAGT